MKQKPVFIIGNFGYKSNQLDGQTVKTRSIYELLKKANVQNIQVIDTSYKTNVLRCISLFRKKGAIVFVGGENSFRFLFPILFYSSKYTGNEIYYNHVGSFLTNFLPQKSWYIKMLNLIKANYAQTKILVNDLEKIGLKNIEYLPNFRVIDFKTTTKVEGKPLKIVYFGRILKEKGVDLIIKASKQLYKQLYKEELIIDFYGQIIEGQESFEQEVNKTKGLTYCGELLPKNVYETLSKYDVLVFPTYFHEEGFPGAILDAYLSGLPVIASDWLYNSELIDHGINGLLFEAKNSQALYNCILYLLSDPNLLETLKRGAIEKANGLHYSKTTRRFTASILDDLNLKT